MTGDRERLEKLIARVFKTVTGKRLAEELYLNVPGQPVLTLKR